MNWRYKINIWIFWIKVICLSFGASGFWAFVMLGLWGYIFKIPPSENNVYGICMVWIVLFIVLLPISAKALYRLTIKQTHGEFQLDIFTRSKSNYFGKGSKGN